MRLSSEFIRLPLQFDVERLLLEAHQFSEYDWDYHPLGYDGNTALSLVSSGGSATNSTAGAMVPTPALERTPYVRQIMATLDTVIGRSRFMRLAPNKNVPAHSDTDYAWRNRVRIHIPIITDPNIIFSSLATDQKARVDVHMGAGEVWIFDNWREHMVTNPTDVRRIHLVIDTVGTAEFWTLAKAGWNPRNDFDGWQSAIREIEFEQQEEIVRRDIRFENYNRMPVRSPDEIETIKREFMLEVTHLQSKSPATYEQVDQALTQLCQNWRAHWALYWCIPEHIEHYEGLIEETKSILQPLLLNVVLQSNRVPAFSVVSNWLEHATDRKASLAPNTETQNQDDARERVSESLSINIPNYECPVFIVSAPRSGSTVLFEALKTNKLLWSLGDESDIESISELHPQYNGYQSNVLSAVHATHDVSRNLRLAFASKLKNSSGVSYADLSNTKQPSNVRLIEKTLKNALRIPFLKTMFPDAKFILVHRDGLASVASLVEAWKSQRFITYSNIQLDENDTNNAAWSGPLIDDWRECLELSIEQTAATQWASIIDVLVDDLNALNATDVHTISYQSLLQDTTTSLRKVCDFCGVPFGPNMQSFAQEGFPNSKFTLSEPSGSKWQAKENDLIELKSIYAASEKRMQAFVLNK